MGERGPAGVEMHLHPPPPAVDDVLEHDQNQRVQALAQLGRIPGAQQVGVGFQQVQVRIHTLDGGFGRFVDVYFSSEDPILFKGIEITAVQRVGRFLFQQVEQSDGDIQAFPVPAGPIPIETSEGWLLIYHGVLTSCNGFVYSFGAALLDLDQPWRVLYRGEPYLLAPQAPYERTGDVPNVAFPCAALVDGQSGRLAIYYGGADTVVCLAFGYVAEVIDFVKANSKL